MRIRLFVPARAALEVHPSVLEISEKAGLAAHAILAACPGILCDRSDLMGQLLVHERCPQTDTFLRCACACIEA